MDTTTTLTGMALDVRRVHRGSNARKVHLDTYRKNRQIQQKTQAQSKETLLSDFVAQPAHQPVAQVVSSQTVAPAMRAAEQVIETQPINYSQSVLTANLSAITERQLAKSENISSLHHLTTIVVGGLACCMLAVGIFTFVWKADTQAVVAQPISNSIIEVEAPASSAIANNPALPENSPSVPSVTSPYQPKRLAISSLGINAKIEAVGSAANGIDTPRSYGLVGWFNKSAPLGSAGPTVLVGHQGAGTAVSRLSELKTGELITLSNGKSQNFTYRVSKKAEYGKNQLPMESIMKTSSLNRLEIITSSGPWQSSASNQITITADLVL